MDKAGGGFGSLPTLVLIGARFSGSSISGSALVLGFKTLELSRLSRGSRGCRFRFGAANSNAVQLIANQIAGSI